MCDLMQISVSCVHASCVCAPQIFPDLYSKLLKSMLPLMAADCADPNAVVVRDLLASKHAAERAMMGGADNFDHDDDAAAPPVPAATEASLRALLSGGQRPQNARGGKQALLPRSSPADAAPPAPLAGPPEANKVQSSALHLPHPNGKALEDTHGKALEDIHGKVVEDRLGKEVEDTDAKALQVEDTDTEALQDIVSSLQSDVVSDTNCDSEESAHVCVGASRSDALPAEAGGVVPMGVAAAALGGMGLGVLVGMLVCRK